MVVPHWLHYDEYRDAASSQFFVVSLSPQLEASVLKLVMFMQATNVVSERSLEEYTTLLRYIFAY